MGHGVSAGHLTNDPVCPILISMKGPIERTPGADAPPRIEEDLSLVPVRRRGEGRRLAALSTIALVLVAVAVAKPWGGNEPAGRTATASATAGETQGLPIAAADWSFGTGRIDILMPGSEASGWTCTTFDPAGSPDPSSVPPVVVYPAESVSSDFGGGGGYICQIFSLDGPPETFEPVTP